MRECAKIANYAISGDNSAPSGRDTGQSQKSLKRSVLENQNYAKYATLTPNIFIPPPSTSIRKHTFNSNASERATTDIATLYNLQLIVSENILEEERQQRVME